MPRATVQSGIELEYETFGNDSDPPMLLVMGLGAQMIAWDDDFCGKLAGEGFHVIRYDNRDVGLSTHLEQRVDLGAALEAALTGGTVDAPYRITDLAADARGLLDHLGIAAAHVVGASMGGMIVQVLAAETPERLRSATSIMSTTGAADVGQPSPEAIAMFLGRRATTEDEYVTMVVESERLLNGPVLPFDEERAATRARRVWQRGYDPAGFARQFTAILASPDRTDGLRGVDVPFLVIHGKVDPLVHVSGGEATAAAVPGAELLLVDDLGHNLPTAHWDTVITAVVDHAGKAG